MPRILEQKATVMAVRNKGSQTLPMRLSVTSDSAISRGQVTLCYLANENSSKRAIFLKQFKQPGPRVNWYVDYLNYLKALKDRIDNTSCKFLTCKIFSVFEYQKSIFEAMEYLQGISLKKYLEFKPFSLLTPLDYQARIHCAVCFIGALKAFHNAGIVHTDLKPENIFLEDAPNTKFGFTVKLIDLDYAIIEDAQSLPWDAAQSQAIAGTPGYFPPERYTGEKYGKYSDMFTAGVILQEILCAQTPFPKSDYDSIVNPAVKSTSLPQPPVFPSFVNPQIAAAMGTFITQCLSPEKSVRLSASKMLQVLIQFQNAVASGKTQQPSPTQTRPRRPIGCVIALQGPAGAMLFNDSTNISAKQLKDIDLSASEIADRFCQFSIHMEDNSFFLIPNLSANSAVLINGNVAETRQRLRKGDIISLSNGDKSSNNIKVDIKGDI